MTRDEIVTALRCCEQHKKCEGACPLIADYDSISQLDGANSSLMAANEKLAADRKALINELCQYCGKYKQAHEGACDGCKWRGM